MIRPPPSPTRTYTLFPYTPRFRSADADLRLRAECRQPLAPFRQRVGIRNQIPGPRRRPVALGPVQARQAAGEHAMGDAVLAPDPSVVDRRFAPAAADRLPRHQGNPRKAAAEQRVEPDIDRKSTRLNSSH